MIGKRLLGGEFYLLTRKFFRSKNLWLIIPVVSLFLSWILSVVGASTFAPDVSKGFKFLVFLFAPGCYVAVVLGKVVGLRLDEVLALDILISTAVAMFVSIYLSFSFLQISETEMVVGLFLVTILSGLLLLPRLLKPDKLRGEVSLSRSLKPVLGLLASFLIGFFFILTLIPESYWRGWDPWLNTPVAEAILEGGHNPFELSSRYAGVANVRESGFYYFLAAIQAFTSIDFYSISRFGGPVLAGMATMITYLVVRRLEGGGAGFLASFFLLLNPFFVKRFSMILRENFGFVFFLGILFLLIVRGRGFHRDWGSRFCFSFVIGLFLAVSLSVHSLVPVIVYGTVVLVMVFWFFRTGRVSVELIFALFLSCLLAAPHLLLSMRTYVWTVNNWFSLSLELLLFVFAVAIALIVFVFYSRKRILKSSGRYGRKVLFLMGGALFVGAVYSIVFPKDFPILGSYNPPVTLDMFALSILLLACLGFLTAFRSPVSIDIISLSLLLILIPNLTNVNVAFPLFRLVIYMSWILSYGAARFLRFIYDKYEKVRLKFSRGFRFFGKTFEIGNWRACGLVCVMSLMFASPIMFRDLQAAWVSWRYANYREEEVGAALSFVSLLKDHDIVVPQGFTGNLLIFAGIDTSKMINNKTILQELYSANTLERFSRIILSSYPRASKVYVFILQRFIGLENCPYPSEQFLEDVGERYQLGSVVYYTVPISYSEKGSLESWVQIQLPIGARARLVAQPCP